ncbi:MAG: type II toxin-antitoxin system PemK/MazF family toxin [Pseudomonadota bacterium]
MRRGEVWWADLPPPAGNRPVVVLTRDSVLDSIDGIVAVLVTRTIRGLPTEVSLGRRQGLPIRCVANLDNILTIPRLRFKRLMGSCDSTKIDEMDRALCLALGVKPPPPAPR